MSAGHGDRESGAEHELRLRLEEVESQRREFETRLRMLEHAVETMSTGVTISDMEGKIIYVNPADARMHGYAVDELVGQEARGYAATGSPMRPGYEPLEPWTRERIDATKDGRPFPVRLTSGRLRDSAEQPLATVTVCEDLRERKQIQEALARHDLILEALGLAAEKFLTDVSWERNVEEVLRRLGRATGVDLIYITLFEETGPFAPTKVLLSWKTAGGEDEVFTKDLGLRARIELVSGWGDRLRAGETLAGRAAELPAAERRVLESSGVGAFAAVPIFAASTLRGYLSLEDGDPGREWSPAELQALRTAARTFGASLHKREAEQALQASEEKYRDLLDNANDLVQSVSPDGRFQYVNRAWLETLGYGREEVETLLLWDVVRPEYPGSDHDVVGSILSGEEENRIEAIFVTKGGEEIVVEGSVNCRYVDGMPVSTRGIFRDITERKRAERMVQEFISTVSHELRTPLTSIIASLGLLESGVLAKRPDRAGELVSVAHRNSNRLLGLINNLLDLQKISAGKMPFKIQPVSVRPVLDEALADIRAFADDQQIGLRLAEAASDLRVAADRERLLQVLNNLLSNAIKFSPDGGEVTVTAERRDDRVRITVSDQGPGIPEDFRASLFDRFTQFDSGGKRRAGGSGLGLSIVQGLVEGMEGTVALADGVEVGSTFEVELPAAEPAE